MGEVGYLDLVQLFLITWKLMGLINWSWWFVFAPMIIALIVVIMTKEE